MNRLRLVCAAAFAVLSLFVPAAFAQDVVTVGSLTTSSTTVDIPVSIRDTAGTPLGIDKPSGSRIQAFSIRVDYAPAAAVSSVTFTRAGVTASLTPTFETSPSSAGSISLLDTFQESSNLIPFTSNAPLPGNTVAHLVFHLSASATPGSSITLTLNPATTQLTDEGGSAATKESPGNGNLTLVNGVINIAPLTVALTPNPASAQIHATSTLMTATISATTASTVSVALTSSNPSVATVPASVNIPAGSLSASFPVNPLAIGTTNITATLPPATGGNSTQATLDVVPPGISMPFNTTVPVGGSTLVTISISTPQPTDTVVTLVSSDTTVATVPATVTIPAGQPNATFTVNGLKLGGASVTATLPAALGSRTAATNLDVTNVCLTPAVPVVSGPTESASGAAYDVTWAAVGSATEYQVDEATDASFTNPTTKTVTTTKATYSHVVGVETRYYYRVRARNHSGNCDNISASSTAVSVLVHVSVAPVMRVLPVVGSLPGANGSFFKTSVQLYNPKSSTITGKIVYHPSGTSGSDSDPSLVYALAPGKTIAYDDLLPAISRSGLGTADIVADLNSSLPLSAVRVFNDAGANGTSGLSEDAVKPEDALLAGDSGALLAPTDFAKFRLNIGIRTLDQGATMTITVRDKDGVVVKTVEKSFGPTFFTQPGASTLLDGFTLTGGETLTFAVTGGSAVIYGSTTDNVTNDPSMQLVRKF